MIYEPMLYRVCRTCNQTLPIVEFWKGARRIGGRQIVCRHCTVLKYKGKSLRETIEAPEGFRYCDTCNRILEKSEFHFVKDHYRRTCKQCVNTKRRKGRQPARQPGQMVKCTKCKTECPWSREFFGWSAKSGVVQPCKNCINSRTREAYRANPDVALNRKKAWRNAHPTKIRTYAQQRLARKRSLPDTLTDTEWIRCLEWWGNVCAYCENPPGFMPGMNITADHFVALTLDNCPGTVAVNIIPSCQSCNTSKSNRDPLTWLTERYGPREAKRILARIEQYFEWVREQDK